MKRLTQHRTAAFISLVAAFLLMTSCIYDVPGDRFYRTLWATSEPPFEGLTLEFLCDGWISVQSPEVSTEFYGHYQPYEMTAYFTDLTIIIEDREVVIEEAHRTNDLLLISWHLAEDEQCMPAVDEKSDRMEQEDIKSGLSCTTRLHRLSVHL